MIGLRSIAFAVSSLLAAQASMAAQSSDSHDSEKGQHKPVEVVVQLGPRPYFLIEDMAESPLKSKLKSCADRKTEFDKTPFSIGHRGACMQFPEHTVESYVAAARMGAGIIECDVTFTKDKALVCRHAQNDLHTTTDILVTPLADKCIKPFTPATFDAEGNLLTAASAECRTSELTLAEFKTLKGKMDAFNPRATTPQEYLAGTANWRTDLYSGPTSGTLMTHAESIALFKSLDVKMTPELKAPSVQMPFDSDGDGTGDYTQEDYAQQMIGEYKAARVSPRDVFAQSFQIEDIRYWIANEPKFGAQAVYLDDAEAVADLPDAAELLSYKAEGINYVAPPLFALLAADGEEIVPSQYALDAKAADLEIITWTLERSGILADGNNGFYYQTFDSAISREGDMMRVLDVLAREVGIKGIFTDWPATVTFYANCVKPR
jgi:glycerophosphoryl diester phosphodiesterase